MAADGQAHGRVLAQWRAQGHERVDPVQFAFLEAMQRRAEAQGGALREVLEARIAALVTAYRARIETATVPADLRKDQATLVARVGLCSHAGRGPTEDRYPEMEALGQFRAMWATLRTESQMRQTLAQEPTDGGPLNSSVLVHRTIQWMGELSPAYLQHFLAYVDNLAWLDTLQQRGTLPSRDSAAPGTKPRRSRTAR